MKNKNGITLIALVITIIIMLILVVVTIDFSTEGGLINKSKKAVDVANAEFARDELLQYITKDFDLTTNTVNFEKLAERLAKSGNWKDTIVLEKYLMVTNSQTGETYKIDINGEISSAKNPKNLTDLEKLLLGEYGQGKNIAELFSGDTEEGIVNPYSSKSSKVYLKTVWSEEVDEDGNEIFTGIFKYEDKLYTLKAKYNEVDESITTLPDPGVKLGFEKDENSRVGELVAYNKGLYIIIYDDDIHGTQMINIAVNMLGFNSSINVGLGEVDSTIVDWTNQEIIDEVDFDKNGILDNGEKAAYSYNHAVEILNNAAKSQFEFADGVFNPNVLKDIRCLGSDPVNPYLEKNKKYTSDLLRNTNFNGKLLDENNTAMSDYLRLIGLDLVTLYRGSPYKTVYCYASRNIYIDDNGDINLCINSSMDVDSIGLGNFAIGSIKKSANYKNIEWIEHGACNVWPVLILQDGILDNAPMIDGAYDLTGL